MPKIQSTRSVDPDSYDVWDAGSRNDIVHLSLSHDKHTDLPLLPFRILDLTRSDNRWFQHVNYRYMALELILHGAMEYRLERRRLIAEEGMLYVVARGSNVHMVNAGRGPRRKLTLLITGRNLNSIAETLGFGHDQLLKLSNPRAVEWKIREIGKGIEEKKSPAFLSARTYELLLELAAERPRKSDELQPALDAIAETPAKKFTVPELAALCGISESTFRRRFLADFGQPPHRYLRERKLRLAAELLCAGKARIKEIAASCGFSTPLRFSLSFQAYYGISPVQFRKQCRTVPGDGDANPPGSA